MKADPADPAYPGAHRAKALVRVWDPFVRLFHWVLVLSIAVAWFSPQRSQMLHTWSGFVAFGLIGARLIWGILGSRYARFSQFVCGPARTASYVADILSGRERRYVGHNPAGGAMVTALMATVILSVSSGWMMTTDTWFGVPWVETAHRLLTHLVLVLAGIHVCGVLLASARHEENLVRAMVTGDKRAASGDDVD